MGTAARWVIGIIVGSIIASPFTEPINWWINRYLDGHPQTLPNALAQAWWLIQMAADFIPGGLFPGIALGATIAFLLLRGWKRNRLASPQLQSEDRKRDKVYRRPRSGAYISRIAATTDRGHESFDYSTDGGFVPIGTGDREFRLRFTKASDTSIHLNKEGTNLAGIARIKGARTGSVIDFNDYDSSSRNYTIQTGEHFIVANQKGYFLQGRVIQIQDDTRGAERDGVSFDYEIGDHGQSTFLAL